MYSPADLTDDVLTSIQRALAWARFILRDRVEPFAFDSAELIAMLRLTATRHEDDAYYRPHFVAATLIRTDPDRAITESIDNASKTKPDPDLIAQRIMRDWSFIDARIDELTGRISARRTFEVVF